MHSDPEPLDGGARRVFYLLGKQGGSGHTMLWQAWILTEFVVLTIFRDLPQMRGDIVDWTPYIGKETTESRLGLGAHPSRSDHSRSLRSNACILKYVHMAYSQLEQGSTY